MNNLRSLGLALVILLSFNTVSAQEKLPLDKPDYNKPRLFSPLPSSISVDSKILAELLSDNTVNGMDIRFPVSNGDSFLTGKVVSTTSKYEKSVKSVVIRLTNYNGAAFTLSSSTNPDGTASYVGRIISFQHGDAFELVKKGDQYFLNKKLSHELIME